MLQAIKVWLFRCYYSFISFWAWRRGSRKIAHRPLTISTGSTPLRARLYANEQGATKPLIVYFHGGGWVIGNLANYQPVCQELSNSTGHSVIAIEYRLAPEHPFPAAPDDCLAATRNLATRAGELAPCNGRLVIAGDSAGANLATCTCLDIDGGARESIVGELLIYPATDHYMAGFGSYVEKASSQALTTGLMHWFWDTYLADLPAEAPAAQRAFPQRSGELSSLPPTFLVTAENDPLRDEGKAYAGQLQQAGVPVSLHHFDNADHGFACSEGPTADFRLLMAKITAWLEQLK